MNYDLIEWIWIGLNLIWAIYAWFYPINGNIGFLVIVVMALSFISGLLLIKKLKQNKG